MNYDAVGNLIFDSYTNPGKIDAMTYDAENHMTSAANGGHQYRYNAEGKRVKRIISGQGEFWMVYGIGGELVAEYNATSGIPLQTSPNKEYGYRSGQMLVVWDDTETNANMKLKWLVTDQLGSTRMEIGRDGAANSVVRHDYLPFGEELGGTKRSGNGFGAVTKTKQKFTSKQRDNETGLDFFEARFMSSVQGRFTGADEFTGGPTELFAVVAAHNPTFYAELAEPQSLNKYTYCLNNPYKFVDPDGHQSTIADGMNAAGQALQSQPNPYAQAAAKVFFIAGAAAYTVANTDWGQVKKDVLKATESLEIVPCGEGWCGKQDFPHPPQAAQSTAQPKAAPAPMQAGSTKNEQKVNTKAYDSAKKAADTARGELAKLKAKPNKTPTDAATKKTLEGQLNNALDRMKDSELHAKKKRG